MIYELSGQKKIEYFALFAQNLKLEVKLPTTIRQGIFKNSQWQEQEMSYFMRNDLNSLFSVIENTGLILAFKIARNPEQ